MNDSEIVYNDLPDNYQRLVRDVSFVDADLAFRLSNLMRSVNGETDKSLSTLNIENYINPQSFELSASAKYGQWPRWLNVAEWARNVIVLIPITLTWTALSSAAKAYNNLLSANPESIKYPFLLLWERGFDGYGSNSMTFSQLAQYDFLLLSAVVVITLFVHLWRDMVEVNAGKKAFVLRQRLEKFMRDLEEKVSKERYSTNGSRDFAGLDKAVEVFRSQSQQTLDLISKDLARLEILTNKEKEERIGMGEFVKNFQQSVLQLRQQVQSITPIYAQINQSLANFLDSSHAELKQQDAISSSMLSLSKNVEENINRLQGIELQIKSILDQIITSINISHEGRKYAEDTVERLNDLISRLVDGETTLRNAVIKIGESSQESPIYLKEVADNVQVLNGLIQKFENTLSEFRRQIGITKSTEVAQGQSFSNRLIIIFLIGNMIVNCAILIAILTRLF